MDIELADTQVVPVRLLLDRTRCTSALWATPRESWRVWARQASFPQELVDGIRYIPLGFIKPHSKDDKLGYCMLSYFLLDMLQAGKDPFLQKLLRGRGPQACRLKALAARISLLLFPSEGDDENKQDLNPFQKFLTNAFGRSTDLKKLGELRDLRLHRCQKCLGP